MKLLLGASHESDNWDKFWSKVDAEGDCWEWVGGTLSKGYGYFSQTLETTKRKTWLAHRVAYQTLVGRIPSGMTIDHLCRRRNCVNPDHLEVVSRGENNLRGVGLAAQNARKTHCKWGHPFDEKNTHIRRAGQRECRACAARRARDYRRS